MAKAIQEIIVATKNAGKVAEFKEALNGLPFNVLSLADLGDFPEAPEDGQTFAENACFKAKFYAQMTGKLCLADDSGLEVDFLNGAPGVYSARYAGEDASDEENNQKLLHQLDGVAAKQRTGRFRCVLVLADNEKVWCTADGTVEGILLTEPRGANGFGYDPLLFYPALNCTLAEMSGTEKNKISHRGRAIQELVKQLVVLEK